MGKGLPYSTRRGNPQTQNIVKQTITLEDAEITVTAVSTGAGYGSLVIGDFPEGNVLLQGAVGYFKFDRASGETNITAAWQGDFGLGTTPATSNTITGDDVNIVTSAPLAAASGGNGVITRGEGSAQKMFDNTDGSREINLNVLVDGAHITNNATATLVANGQLHIAYTMLGDD